MKGVTYPVVVSDERFERLINDPYLKLLGDASGNTLDIEYKGNIFTLKEIKNFPASSGRGYLGVLFGNEGLASSLTVVVIYSTDGDIEHYIDIRKSGFI